VFSRVCTRCKERGHECRWAVAPTRRKACQRCCQDKKTCSERGADSQIPSKVKRPERPAAAVSNSKTKRVLESVERYEILEAINRLNARVERLTADVALHRAEQLDLMANQEKMLGLLVQVRDDSREVKTKISKLGKPLAEGYDSETNTE
jgi:hypothetical protein